MTFLGHVTYSNVKVRKTRLFLQDTFLEKLQRGGVKLTPNLSLPPKPSSVVLGLK